MLLCFSQHAIRDATEGSSKQIRNDISRCEVPEIIMMRNEQIYLLSLSGSGKGIRMRKTSKRWFISHDTVVWVGGIRISTRIHPSFGKLYSFCLHSCASWVLMNELWADGEIGPVRDSRSSPPSYLMHLFFPFNRFCLSHDETKRMQTCNSLPKSLLPRSQCVLSIHFFPFS